MIGEDWDQYEVIVKLLKPLQLTTTVLCSEQQITILMVNIYHKYKLDNNYYLVYPNCKII